MSNYEKQNFIVGQLLTADHLNHIEDGIVSLENEELTSEEIDQICGILKEENE